MYILTYDNRPIDCGSYRRGDVALSPKTWTSAPTGFTAKNVWTDHNGNIYYSKGSIQKVLDVSTSTWVDKTWNVALESGEDIWMNNYRQYFYSHGSTQYYSNSLSGDGSWSNTTWNESHTSFYGRYIWKVGNAAYYSNGSTQWKYDLRYTTKEWKDTSWTGFSGANNFNGNTVWTDGSYMYLNHPTVVGDFRLTYPALRRWDSVTISGLSGLSGDFRGERVWHHGSDTYYSSGGYHFKLNTATMTWENIDIAGDFNGDQVWSDGTNLYVDDQYMLRFDVNPPQYNFITYGTPEYSWVDTLVGDIAGSDVYGDGNHYYFSFEPTGGNHQQYALNRTNDTWEAIDGFISANTGNIVRPDLGRDVWEFNGKYIWSGDSQQYILNLDTRRATPITWGSGDIPYPYSGDMVWKDGNSSHVYYSWGTGHYQLYSFSSGYSWYAKTWNGLTNFAGSHVWRDLSGNVYYSSGENQYQLNKSTSTWTEKIWYGLDSFSGRYVWTDNQRIFVSTDTSMYVLNTTTSTWSRISFGGTFIRPTGRQVYWYKGNLYYGTYKLVRNL